MVQPPDWAWPWGGLHCTWCVRCAIQGQPVLKIPTGLLPSAIHKEFLFWRGWVAQFEWVTYKSSTVNMLWHPHGSLKLGYRNLNGPITGFWTSRSRLEKTFRARQVRQGRLAKCYGKWELPLRQWLFYTISLPPLWPFAKLWNNIYVLKQLKFEQIFIRRCFMLFVLEDFIFSQASPEFCMKSENKVKLEE